MSSARFGPGGPRSTASPALALAGLLFAVAFAGSPPAAFGAAPAGAPLLGRFARVLAILAPQLAFVAGVLAVLRVLWRRHGGVLAAAEAQLIVRRATVATVAGLSATVSLGVIALVFARELTAGWQLLALVAAGVGTVALLAVTPSLLAAIRLRPTAPGPAGDLLDDLGPAVPGALPGALRASPWRLAVLTAAAVAAAIALAGAAGGDLYDGIARGVADGLLCLGGFGTLGRYLGLWTRARSAAAGADRA